MSYRIIEALILFAFSPGDHGKGCDIAKEHTPDAGIDAAIQDAGPGDADASLDTGVDVYVDPQCAVDADVFDPGAQCGRGLSTNVSCTHKVTQQAMATSCCVPKNPGQACVPNLPTDTNCCTSLGIYCGVVEETTVQIPTTLQLWRMARTGTGFCSGGITTPSETKVGVTAVGTAPGITLALALFEKPACAGGGYNAWFSRTDTTVTYAGAWNDHPDMSNNRDSSGAASVTMNVDGTITYSSNGTVLMDYYYGTINWIRRTNVGKCSVTFVP